MPGTAQLVREEVARSKLPPLPHVLVELLRICQDQSSSFHDMARVIANDAVISAQLLNVANSAYFGRAGGAQTIDRALLLLGTDQLKTICITASVQQMCRGFGSLKPDFLKSFWHRSLRCALIAKALAQLTSYRLADEAYLLGLLHNMGELVLASNHSENYPEFVQKAAAEQIELENARFGLDHCQLSRYLAEQWSLDLMAAESLAHHHAPLLEVVDAHHLTKILFLAALLAEEPQRGRGNAQYIELGATEAAERLFGMSGALAREIAARISSEVEQISGALSIDLSADSHADMDDVQKRLGEQLQRRIMNQEMTSLLPGATPNAPALDADVVSRAVNIMFGYTHTLLLKYDEPRNALTVDVREDDPAGIAIPLTTSPSLVAMSANQREIRWSHAAPGHAPGLTVVDRQLMRLCNASSIVYVPVTRGDRLMALMAMGDRGLNPPDDTTLALLHDFASHLGATLHLSSRQDEELDVNVILMQEKVRASVHEVKNPLAIIRNYLEALAAEAESEDKDKDKQFRILQEEIDRAAQILMRLQDFEEGATDSGQSKRSVNDEIKSLVSVFQRSICRSNGVECVLQLGSRLDDTVLPRNQFRQIITNLIKNAVEAMPEGGQVKVATSLVVNSSKGKALEIRIADTGPGLPEKVLGNLFQPGYTTKDGNHSGLGLSITRSLVEEIGGTITCQTSGRGTEFTIMVPLSRLR